MQTLDVLLKIEGAGGVSLPYLGVVFVTIELSGVVIEAPLLVVHDTNYHHKVPLLIGTNILSLLIHLAEDASSTPILSSVLKVLSLRDKHLKSSSGMYGTIHAQTDITIEAGQSVLVTGSYQLGVSVPHTVALVQACEESSCDLTINPGLVAVGDRDSTSLELFNRSSDSVTVKRGAVLGEIHQAVIHNPAGLGPSGQDSVMSLLNLDAADSSVSREQCFALTRLLTNCKGVFSKDPADLGKTDVVTHRIDLLDETPFKERFRRIPPHMFQEVKDHLQQLATAGVIEPSSSPYCSNLVLVWKKDRSLQLCVDFRKLNQRTKRDSYALPTIEELLNTA